MMRSTFSLSSYEGSILWQFFDSVSSAVSNRMLRGSPPGEENLTFLLCELLDESATALHVLDYPISRVKEELAKSDAGVSVDLAFETHEHTKYFESNFSGADLGIIFTIDHPILGQSQRAVLVQAKKLFGRGRSGEYSLYSGYTSYDREQAALLKDLASRFGAWDSIFYLWYNPPSSGFPEDDAKIIRAFEANDVSVFYRWGKMQHHFFDDLVGVGFPLALGGRNSLPNQEQEDRTREWRARQPALRVSPLERVLSLTENGYTPMLKPFYEAMLESADRTAFSPFADFFLLALASSRYGSSNEQWIHLAEGRKIAMPPAKPDNSNQATRLDDLPHAPIPRHTIKVTVSSTLPKVG
jgi:hypothetical protein